MPDDQREVIDFLSRPSSYGPGVARVEVIKTHISLVFLVGERAFKLKRAVTFPCLDFASAEQRRRACAAELALNRRTAPSLYLDLRAIGRRPDGGIGFMNAEPAIDRVVVMRRFDRDRVFDRLAEQGRLNAGLMRTLTGRIAAFHEAAERRFDCGGAAALSAVVQGNDECLKAARHAGFAGLWLEAPAQALEGRIAARRDDASPAVLEQQLRHDPGAIAWVRIDAGAGPEACLSAARRALGLA